MSYWVNTAKAFVNHNSILEHNRTKWTFKCVSCSYLSEIYQFGENHSVGYCFMLFYTYNKLSEFIILNKFTYASKLLFSKQELRRSLGSYS